MLRITTRRDFDVRDRPDLLEILDPENKRYITLQNFKDFLIDQAKDTSKAETAFIIFKNLGLLEDFSDYRSSQLDYRRSVRRFLLQKVILTFIEANSLDIILNFGVQKADSEQFTDERFSCGFELPQLLGSKKRLIRIKRKDSRATILKIIIKIG
jgi:hypothetical protein